MKAINLNERTSYFASAELVEKLKEKNYSEPVINFAYTDYGGSFLDRVLIQYFEETHPEFIVSEDTHYFGKNALVWGNVAAEFLEAVEDYPLGFENTEEYYFAKETEAENKSFKYFLKELKDKYTVKRNALDFLLENKAGHYSVQSSGELDFSWEDLTQYCIDNGIIKPKKK